MRISFVTVTHNRREQVLELLESVYAGTLVPDEVVVVDNASTDNTREEVTRRFPGVKLIRNSENRLVSSALNSGLREATGDFLIAIADDNVLARDCVEELVSCGIRHPEAAVIGPTMYYFDAPDRVWFQSLTINLTTGHTSFRKNAYTGPADVVETDSMPNCLMFSRRALEVVGYLDEIAFPMHHEEADYCLRCRKAGMRIYVCTRAKEWHRVPVPRAGFAGAGDYNVDNPMRAYLHARSRVFLAKRHATWPQRIVYFAVFMPLFTIAYLGICLASGGNRAFEIALAFLLGTWRGVVDPVPRPVAHFDGAKRPQVGSPIPL